ncbi:MAG: cytochrome c [Rhizobiales bacterium]|nr:cytochrome c [Hyphomicrobiales bacterium]NRB14561.1 cytochrome c [Hyphomicrobiales bacterium]
MKRILIITFALFAATFFQAQADELSDRKQLMKSINDYMKILQAQTQDFDANIVSIQATNIAVALESVKTLFSEKGVGETAAKDEIWQDYDRFLELFANSIQASETAAASADMDSLRSNFRKLSRSCGGCHRNFRIRKQ